MIDNRSSSDIKHTVDSVLNDFSSGICSPSIVEKNSDECFLFKFYRNNVSFFFDVSTFVIETKIISGRETIFHNFFYPFNEKIYIVNSDSRILNEKNILLFNDWLTKHDFKK